MTEVCPYCNGTGLLTKHSNLVYDIEEWVKRFKIQSKERSITLRVHPSLAKKLTEGKLSTITRLQLKYFIRIKLWEDKSFNPQMFKIYSNKTDEDITAEY
jgi:ribonuclease G